MFWYEGALSNELRQPFDLTDRGLTLGDGLFDTSLARGGKIVLQDAHLRRLADGAKALAIPLEIDAAARALDALAGTIGNGAVRLTLTRGGGARGLRLPENPKPLLFGTAAPDRSELIFAPLTLATSEIRRNETSPLSRLKTLAYLDAILANKTAQDKGADEALFLNTKGDVACAATGNLFALFDKRLVTPQLSDGVLPGIIRGFILNASQSLGLEAVEESLPLAEWQTADAIFLTNSLRLLAPCNALDRQSFGSATHPLVLKLQDVLRTAIQAECGS